MSKLLFFAFVAHGLGLLKPLLQVARNGARCLLALARHGSFRLGHRLKTDALHRAAEDLGLAWKPAQGLAMSPKASDRASGRIGGFEVFLRRPSIAVGHLQHRVVVEGLQVVVDGGGSIPRDLVLRPAEFSAVDHRGAPCTDASPRAKTLPSAERALPSGDPTFDDRVAAAGDEATVAALLGEQRTAIADAVGGGKAIVWTGRVERTLTGAQISPDAIVGEVQRLLHVAELLRLAPDETAERLARNVRLDASPGLRTHNLDVLLRRFQSSDQTREACWAAVRSPHPELRLLGAREIGDDGLDTLEEIARDESCAQRLRLRALNHLSRAFEAPVAGPRLTSILDARDARVRGAAITGLTALGHAPALGRLLELLPAAGQEEALAIVSALEVIGDEDGERALLDLLASGAGPLRIAAARALGRTGTWAAIGPLKKHASGLYLLVSPELRAAARSSIAQIEARPGADRRGRLSISLVDESDGALSATEGVDGGELSPAPESSVAG